ncbi:MAG TPA: arginine--tRNA ligase [Mucilaginibacter sp.]|nr:arginine--tRNA ligase [Mucilaginibacter sp.]
MDFIIEAAVKAVKALYQTDLNAADISLQPTRKEFEGQITIVTFPIIKFSRKSPEQTGTEIGEFLKNEVEQISGFNVIKGFLNISLSDAYWLNKLYTEILPDSFAEFKPNGKKVMVEYSSPNTNKPLHLGHVRNNLLGYSVAEILKADGYEVIKANLVNDRGIHICKSMLAWQLFANGETPESTGEKGDHLVGKYYVLADKEIKKQLIPIIEDIYENNDLSKFNEIQKIKIEESINNINNLQQKISEPKTKATFEIEEKIANEKEKIVEIARSRTAFMIGAQEMLQKWEAGDEAVISLWKTMNLWVYDGFGKTYKALGVDFDQFYYESDTYLLGKDIVNEGLEKGVFFKKDDGSVWIDLTPDGLDEKLVLRADGTSVYMTQDMGTAQLKYDDFQMDESIYVVGNEQDYHFKVLFLILQKLGKEWAKGLYHLSYGMVDLPSGKMKSREGTVVDADDLISEMEQTAKDHTEALGKVTEYNAAEKQQLYHTIGMGALKYFLLKVDPKKRLLFDPNESVDFQGHTGPFIQYTHARIRSVLGRAESTNPLKREITSLDPEERDLILVLSQFPETITLAAEGYSPAIIANYVYEVAKSFNKFYHEKSILQAEDEVTKQFRLQLSAASAKVIKRAMGLLGIEVPERM